MCDPARFIPFVMNKDCTAMQNHTISYICEGYQCTSPVLPIWHCVDCSTSYCNRCWHRQGPHQQGKTGRDGLPHEKTDFGVLKRMRSILNPPESQDELKRLHEDDVDTIWFGEQGCPHHVKPRTYHDVVGVQKTQYDCRFLDYGRYVQLLQESPPSNKIKYPQLVSFVGATSAKRSVNFLICH